MSAAGEEVSGSFVEFGRASQAAGAETDEVAPHAGDGLAGAVGPYSVHVVHGRFQAAQACPMLPRLRCISALATRSSATIRA
jgi:hypothetical protein